MSTAAAPTTRVESVLQRAELELWRDNIDGALDLLARAHTLAPDHRYAARAEEIRSWLRHLETRGAYAAAHEEYYRRGKGRPAPNGVERGVSARPRRGRGRRHGARVLRPRLLLRGARARARRRDDGGRAPAYAATGRPVLFRRPDERVGGHRPGPGVPASGRRGRPRPRLHRGWPAR